MFIQPKFLYDAAPENNGGGEVDKIKEGIDKQNELRKNLGQEPLPYPEGIAPKVETPQLSQIEQFRADKVKELSGNNSGMTEEEINNEAEKLVQARAAEIEQEKESAAIEARKVAEKEGTTPVIKIGAKAPEKIEKVKEPEIIEEPEVEEAVLLKQLSKKAGREITSLDDFLNPKVELTPEIKEKQEQERENQKVAFALQNKIISKTEIESFIADTKDLQGVAYEFYAATQKQLDDTLTDAEIQENFKEEYGLNEDPDSRRFKAGQQQINFIANSIISKKHAKYLNLENAFSEYENEQNSINQRQQKILQLAPSYKKDVDTVIGSISKIKIGGHEVELDEELLQGYKSQMLNPKYSEALIAQGWTLEQLQTSTRNHVIIENLDGIMSGILESEKLKYQAGQRGIIPQKTGQPKVDLTEVQNEERKKLQERLGAQTN